MLITYQSILKSNLNIKYKEIGMDNIISFGMGWKDHSFFLSFLEMLISFAFYWKVEHSPSRKPCQDQYQQIRQLQQFNVNV